MEVVIRSVIFYLVLVVALRITARRIMRAATPLDMALMFMFGGLSIQAILGVDRSLTSALIALFTISLCHVAVSALMPRWPALGRIIQGTPVVLFKDGKPDARRLAQLRMQEADLLSEVRQNGLRSFDQVDTMILEHQGGITVIAKPDAG